MSLNELIKDKPYRFVVSDKPEKSRIIVNGVTYNLSGRPVDTSNPKTETTNKYVCHVCGKEFDSARKLNGHSMIHKRRGEWFEFSGDQANNQEKDGQG
jgi:hypothetical protein